MSVFNLTWSILLSTLFIGSSLLAQSPNIINFGGGSVYNCFDGIIDNSGNHVFGYKENGIHAIEKLDSNYASQWSLGIGDAGSNILLELTNGNYLTAGNLCITNISPDGVILWQKKMVGSGFFDKIIELNSGDIIASVRHSTSMALVSFDPAGNVNWSKTILHPIATNVYIDDLFKTNDNNLMVVSRFGSLSFNSRILISKLDENGSLLWESEYNAPLDFIMLNNAHETASNDILITGRIMPDGDPSLFNLNDALVLKYDSLGNFLIGKKYGNQYYEAGHDIKEDKNGNFLFIGNSKPVEVCGGNLFVMQLDSNLDTLYTKYYGTSSGNAALYDELHIEGNSVYTYGWGSLWSTFGTADCHLLKTDDNFDLTCERYQQATNIAPFTDYDVISAANSYSNYVIDFIDTNSTSSSSIQVADACTGELLNINEQQTSGLIQIYPNPSSEIINFQLPHSVSLTEIKIANMNGQVVTSYISSMNGSETGLNVSSFDDGIYLYSITVDDQVHHGRFEVKH